jgi:hypothetical protein
MASITYWLRTEPRPRTDSIDQPLQARIRDPLWMLTRQWQLGEFYGDDTGSPAWVQLTERLGRLDSWQADGPPIPLAAAPLEQQLEHEPFSPDLATRVELGQTFERLLADHATTDQTTSFRDAYPITPAPLDPADPVEAILRRNCAGRAIDGIALYTAAQAASPNPPPTPAIPTPRQPAVAAALQAYLAWVQATIGAIGTVSDPASWQPARLEYNLAVTATTPGGTVTLDVHPGSDGLADWAAFDLRPGIADGPTVATNVRSMIPTHVRFRGMPNARFWDFELATADFGAITPDTRDLARLALIDFMLVHANDWLVLPVDVAVGGTYQLDSLIVHDVFGVDTLIQRADREPLGPGRWTLFSTSVTGQDDTTADFYLLPASAGSALQTGRVAEEVRFARDEMADMAWAIEDTLENQLGEPWPQHERDIALNGGTAPPTPAPQNAPVPVGYLIETRVLSYWFPLLPTSLDPAAGTVALELAAQLAADGHTPILPRGRILQPTSIPPGAPYRLPEEEVPRNGIRVQRVVCRSRWTDGSTRVWQLRRVQPGTGQVNSALRFDLALPNG